ncbi:hypothetical protein ACH4GM_00500 [Streptomyces coeruleorubidus]
MTEIRQAGLLDHVVHGEIHSAISNARANLFRLNQNMRPGQPAAVG